MDRPIHRSRTPMTFISHAQNFEDVILWRVLGHVQNGHYIDVGAQDPVTDSVSLAFYERGWRGVHIEPSPQYANKLRLARPDETVLQVALGRQAGVLEFFGVPDTGLSTSNSLIAEQLRAQGRRVEKISVSVMTLDAVMTAMHEKDVQWLKIDVEGAEREVFDGWTSSLVRPWVVVIEATRPLSTELTHHEWEHLLLAKGYLFAYFDGLNRFYVSSTHLDLLEKFTAPPNVFDHFLLTENHYLCALAQAETYEAQNNTLRHAAIVQQYAGTTRQLEEQLAQSADQYRKQEQASADRYREREQASTDRYRELEQASADRYRELEQAYVRLHGELLGVQDVNQQLHHALKALQSSTFWRATAPLRWMAIQLKRLFALGAHARWNASKQELGGSLQAQASPDSNPMANADWRLSAREKAVHDLIRAAMQTSTKRD